MFVNYKSTVDLSDFSPFNIMSYFTCTDLISNLFDPRPRWSWVNFDPLW